ncbi:uncharacterized protein LOC108670709, partial [Hyalella azteca]|uniref:Uncharacterized protein LOC108670709 n=1 Tax=Hyalella azteca TaxID=294128 RepID=A0A8B7NJ67_HYAAZ
MLCLDMKLMNKFRADKRSQGISEISSISTTSARSSSRPCPSPEYGSPATSSSSTSRSIGPEHGAPALHSFSTLRSFRPSSEYWSCKGTFASPKGPVQAHPQSPQYRDSDDPSNIQVPKRDRSKSLCGDRLIPFAISEIKFTIDEMPIVRNMPPPKAIFARRQSTTNALSASSDLISRRGVFSRRHYGSVEM